VEVVRLNFFRAPSNDRFDDPPQEFGDRDGADSFDVHSNLSYKTECEDRSLHGALSTETESVNACGLQHKVIGPVRRLPSLNPSAITAPATEESGISKRLEAFEKKHEQTVLEMMAEIRAIAQKLEDRRSAEVSGTPTAHEVPDDVPFEPASLQQAPE